MLHIEYIPGTPLCIVFIISVLQFYTASCLTLNIYQEPLYSLFTYNICTAVLYSLMFNIEYIPGTPLCIVYIISVLQFYTASCLTLNIHQELLYALFT